MKYLISFSFAFMFSVGALIAQDQAQAPDFKHHSTKKEKKVLKKTSLGSKIIVKKKTKLTMKERYRQKMKRLKNSKAIPKSKARVRRKKD